MSIVVAVTKNDRTVMAADSLTIFGESRRIPPENSTTAKFRRFGDALFGASGWGVYDMILNDYLGEAVPDLGDESAIFAFFVSLWKAMHESYAFVNDQAQMKDSPFGDLDSSFLIANRRGIYKVSQDMDVSRFQQYYAIGSGTEYALGALSVLYDTDRDAATIARDAVHAAITFDVHCDGPVQVDELVTGP